MRLRTEGIRKSGIRCCYEAMSLHWNGGIFRYVALTEGAPACVLLSSHESAVTTNAYGPCWAYLWSVALPCQEWITYHECSANREPSGSLVNMRLSMADYFLWYCWLGYTSSSLKMSFLRLFYGKIGLPALCSCMDFKHRLRLVLHSLLSQMVSALQPSRWWLSRGVSKVHSPSPSSIPCRRGIAQL